MTDKLRVAAYCRVSTDKDNQINSLANQKTYFTDYISQQDNWLLQNIYYDEGISGTQTRKRAGFNAMFRAACLGSIDLILTKEVCRFARNTVDALSYTRKLQDLGVGVIFTIDNIDTRDSDGELRLTLMASIAQEESRKTSERVKWGQKRRMEQGIVFGRDLLGYTVTNGALSVNEAEAALVRSIFHKYTNEGKSSHTIAAELETEGISPKYGKHWTNTAILRVLKNEKYVGDLCQKKTYTPNYLTHCKKQNQGQEELIYLTDHHTPIISRTLWARTRRELLGRSPVYHPGTRHSTSHWCSGKLSCGLCGNHYVNRTKKMKDGSLYRAWRCGVAAAQGSCACSNSSVNEQSLFTCMRYCISMFLPDIPEFISEVLRELAKTANEVSPSKEKERLERKIDCLEAKKRKAIDFLLEGCLTASQLQKQTEWYDCEIQNLRRTADRCPEAPDSLGQSVAVAEQILSPFTGADITGEDITGPYIRNPYENDIYSSLVEKILIFPQKTIEIRLKDLPIGIRIVFDTHGKGVTYTTDILSVEMTKNL